MATKDTNIKNLFKQTKTLTSSSLNEVSRKVESPNYVSEFLADRKRYFPNVDFTLPGNFARFGSAEEYYKKSIENIYKTYPYDGSLKEKYEWHNASSYLDNYILEEEYPRTNGYITLGQNWGNVNTTVNATSDGDSIYKLSSAPQYITIKGGPNAASHETFEIDAPEQSPDYKKKRFKANFYKEEIKQKSNLNIDGSSGNTVEFWLKLPDNPATSQTSPAHAYFDLWNEQAITDDSYGRILIETIFDVNGDGDPDGSYMGDSIFYVSYASGSSGVQRAKVGPNTFPASTNIDLSDWNHYAFVMQNNPTGSDHLLVKMYVNGNIVDTVHTGSQISEVITGSFNANIGAYKTGPTEGLTTAGVGNGYGALSGSSIDEFRFWKKTRDSEQIGTNWFKQVAGGANSDFGDYGSKFTGSANPVDLGVYYKFNEGISERTALDSNVLDYSGRVSNGTIINYNSSPSMRFVGSAIVSASAADSEFKDPILYKNNPRVSSYYDRAIRKGLEYDSRNASAIYDMFPQWVLDEDAEKSGLTIKKLMQILASQFDEVQLYADNLKRFKNINYIGGSLSGSINKPLPFANRLLTSKGFPAPEIFANADVLATLANRDNEREYERALYDVKNQLYTNIHNNFNAIAKSKGTERSIRNLMRSLGVDNELYSINFYANNAEIMLNQSLLPTTVEKNVIDFSHTGSFNASIYQSSASSDVNSVTYITGSDSTGGFDRQLGFTVEVESVFPKKPDFENSAYKERFYSAVTASLFGMHSAVAADMTDSGDTTWDDEDYANFQVYAIKSPLAIGAREGDEQVHFKLSCVDPNSSTNKIFDDLVSQDFSDVYDSQRWNFAVKMLPETYPNLSTTISGSTGYRIEFHGYNTIGDQVANSFVLTSSISNANGLEFLTKKKRLYLGAHRENFTGSVIQQTNYKVSACRYWALPLETDEIIAHAVDASNHGLFNPNENAYLFQDFKINVPKIDTLALNWEFSTITGSDALGNFEVLDLSSGSNDARYGVEISNLLEKNHTGRGFGFNENISDCVHKEFLFSYKQQVPDNLDVSDTIHVLDRDDEMFTTRTQPIKYSISVEKSMYEVVSEEMLNFMAACVNATGLENLVGNNVDKYRQKYKGLEKVRNLFFEKIGNTPDLDKYLEYYKWLDYAISEMISALVPMSAGFKDIENVVESHILERSKYQHKFPTLEFKTPDPEGIIKGINELVYDWEFGHAPIRHQASCVLNTTTPIILTSTENIETASNRNGKKFILNVSAPAANFSDIVIVGFSAVSTGISVGVIPNDGTNNGGTPVDLTTAELVELINNGSVVGKNIGLSDPSNVRTLQTATGGDATDLADGGEGDGEIGTFAGGTTSTQAVNCNWWNKKVDREDSFLATGITDVDVGRAMIHSASLQVFNRDFNKPYKMSLRQEGLKTRLNKKSVVLTELKPFDNSRNITFDTRTFVSGNVNCADDLKINPNLKRKADYQVQISDATNTHSKYSSGLISPYSFYSSSVNNPATGVPTGYQASSQHLRDYYVETKDVPMQGPFTEQHVGGNQYRHTNLAYKPIQLNGPTDPRKDYVPQAWYALAIPAGGELFYTIVNPSYFGSTFTRADFTRETLAKRPVNIKNIKTDTSTFSSSYGSILPIGNYSENYEVVQIADRSVNNRYFVENNGILAAPTSSTSVFGLKDYEVPDRGRHASIMVNRFSAPGGPEINSAGFLDYESETYSVYNALPFRNLTVRQPLKSFLTAHSLFGGYSSLYGEPSASYHKTQRNGAKRIENSEARVYSQNPAGVSDDGVLTSSVYDNYWVQHMIPQSDLQYSWITASAVSFPFGYSQPDLSNASEAATDMVFATNSNHASYLYWPNAADASIFFNLANSDSPGDFAEDSIVIISTDGTSISYIFKDDGATATGGLDGLEVVVQCQGFSDRDQIAAELVNAINSANGHNRGVSNSVIELSYNTGSDRLTLTQVITGPAGNTAISAASLESNNCLNVSGDGFSGGEQGTPLRYYGINTDSLFRSWQNDRIEIDFVGLNTTFYDVLNTGSNTITATNLNTTFNSDYAADSYPNFGKGLVGRPAKLNALNLRRNGAGGFSSWKQVRQSYHPLVRNMHKTNTISLYQQEPVQSNNVTIFLPKLLKYTEPPVSFKNKPLLHEFLLDTNEEIVVKSTYANSFEIFANPSLNTNIGYSGREDGDEVYDDLKKIYIDNLLPPEQTSIEDLQSFKYKETVYPKNVNVGLARTRGRENYTRSSGSADFNKKMGSSLVFWKDRIINRLRSEGETSNSQENIVLSGSSYFGMADYSIWPLDAELPFFDLYFASGAAGHIPLTSEPFDPYYFSPISPSGSLLDVTYEPRWADVKKNGELSCAGYIYNLLNPNLQGRARRNNTLSSSAPAPGNFRWAMALNKEEYNSLAQSPQGKYQPSASLQYEFPNLVPSGTTDLHTVEDSAGQTFVPSGNLCLIPPYRADVLSERRPWFNSYEEYSEDIRRIGKDYSVIPEFRISDHLMEYHENGFFGDSNNFMDLIGCSLNNTSSAASSKSGKNDTFFNLYSHTDFLKHFSVFREDHKKGDVANLTSIRLECNGIKKLLPYQGFYPVLRSVQLGSLFSSSYGSTGYITGSSVRSKEFGTRAGGIDESGDQERMAALLQPFFAPGIFYNTIKSGIAVSYPCHTGSAAKTTISSFIPVTDGTSGSYFAGKVLGNAPDHVFPFEAILDPGAYLPISGTHQTGRNTIPPPTSSIFFTYSQLTGTTSQDKTDGFYLEQNGANGAVRGIVAKGTSSAPEIYVEWLGKSDPYYKLAAHNFFAEVEDFFLEKKRPTHFQSVQSSKFKGMTPGVTYYMDVVLRSSDKFISYEVPSGSFKYQPFPKDPTTLTSAEQDVIYNYHLLYGDGKSELPLMNVRGMHYGPPYQTSNLLFGSSGTGSVNYANGHFEDPAYAPHTPPYFYGQAVARIAFTPTDDVGEPSRVYTLDEIIAGAQTETIYYNQNERARQFADYATYQSYAAYKMQMQLSSSVNLFGKVIGKNKTYFPGPNGTFIEQSVQDNDFKDTNESWVIETKFECPSINMYDMDTDSLGAGSPGDGSNASPGSERFYTKGIWKGFGEISKPDQGIFIELKESFPGLTDDNGEPFIQANQSLSSDKGSLLKKCGFQAASKKVGEIASNKTIYEAIVAIPIDSKNNFFKIDQESFDIQLENIEAGNPAVKAGQLGAIADIKSTSISDMIQKMKKFYLPPRLDFIKNKSLDPFVMYIFEFSHTFNKQDLSYIWQNLMPDISITAEKEVSSIEHTVGTLTQFFSKGTDSTRSSQDNGSPFEDTTRWMVFKIKQRAKNNYNATTIKSERSQGFSVFKNILGQENIELVLDIDGEKELDYSYNWPYDFCSLVELAKIDTEVQFSDASREKNVVEIEEKPYSPNGKVPIQTLINNGQSRGSFGSDRNTNTSRTLRKTKERNLKTTPRDGFIIRNDKKR